MTSRMTVVPVTVPVVMAPARMVNAMTAIAAKVAAMVVMAAGVVVAVVVAVANVRVMARVNKARSPIRASASVSMPKVVLLCQRLL